MRTLLLFGALTLVAGPVPARAEPPRQQPTTISTAQFAALPILRKPLLSPNGQRIVARSIADGKTTLAILDANKPESPPRNIALGKANVAALEWAGNDRLLLTIQSKQILPYDDEIAFLRLIAIDVSTGYSKVVDQKSRGTYAGDVLYTDPTGSWALVASQDTPYVYPSVKRVDLATGDATVVEMLRYDRKTFSATRYFREWRSRVQGDGKVDLVAVSPIKFPDRLKVPIFIAHGEQDDTVLAKQSHAMVAALTKANAQVTSVFYKDSAHDFGSSADLEDWLRRLEAFLARNNPA